MPLVHVFDCTSESINSRAPIPEGFPLLGNRLGSRRRTRRNWLIIQPIGNRSRTRSWGILREAVLPLQHRNRCPTNHRMLRKPGNNPLLVKVAITESETRLPGCGLQPEDWHGLQVFQVDHDLQPNDMLVGIHHTEDNASLPVREIASNVLSILASASRDTEIRISVSRGVAGQPERCSFNRAILDLGVRPQAIE